MKRIKILVLSLIGLFASTNLLAQQESQYTQYMYNTTLFNPAYAGSREVASIFGTYRTQWVGIDGAPKTTALSFHMPIEDKNVGIGASVFHETIGPLANTALMVDFSYTLQLENESKLAFGIKGTAGLFHFDRNKITLRDYRDPYFLNARTNTFLPNVGVGAFWYSNNYYLGVSIPSLLSTESFDAERAQSSTVGKTQHYYLIGGYVFDINENVKFKPAALVKAVQGAPLQFDLSANFMFNEKFVVGGAWRYGAAVSLMAGFQIDKNWFLGYAYDYETTDLRKYNSGSHEVFLRYEFYKDLRRIISPRFF